MTDRLVFLVSYILLALLVVACSDGGAPAPMPTAPPPAKRAALPADFVLCIDNSASIGRQEQDLLRETAMLLADLADPGDRIAVLTFDEDAREVKAVQVRGDDDRRTFQRAVRDRVDFRGRYSDIRRCIRLLVEKQNELFGAPGTSVRVPIVLSDGKLEPQDRKFAEAFREMRADVQGPLADTGLYALALGDKASLDPLPRVDGGPVNGLALMREHVARVPDRYFQARKFDEVLPIAVGILNRAKGVSSLGEEGAREFLVDDTVEWMSFIVRKRSVDSGTPLADSSEIEIVAPRAVSETPITLANHRQVLGNAAYWSQYHHFDLIIVRRPPPGKWAIRLSSDRPVEVISKIVTPVTLRVERRPFYFLNEAGMLAAFLQNRDTGAVDRGDFVLQAKVAAGTPLKDSKRFATFSSDSAGHQYLLAMPGAVAVALGKQPEAGAVEMEVIAQRRTTAGGSDVDPWFVRRSGGFTVELREPFVDFMIGDRLLASAFDRAINLVGEGRTLLRLPFSSLQLVLGADLHLDKATTPAFETPPRLTVEVEQRKDDGATYETVLREVLASTPDAQQTRYRLQHALSTNGDYRYRYRLAGNTPDGPFALDSPWYGLRLGYAWMYLGAAAVLVLVVLEIVSRRTARLQGQLAASVGGRQYALSYRPGRVIDSEQLAAMNQKAQFGGARFRLEARRLLFVAGKRVRLTMLAGQGTLDGRPLGAGAVTSFPPRQKQLSLRRDDGSTVVVMIGLRVA
ncbi:vWA domain-containing protein [Accumulibacter sp.]|uniref:vWA domain-containing protein n=1 Tax=Accumulibacter sp. TaxID=2053492 RepID=UPI0025ED0E41|nr:vWA domain-containing protein [Accumulibacter sp.]MCM8595567.1 VWA domain-containing protein [Accumulibacter sp.]MCM8625062.1 VWA domain-containing protein [Accumulibacter sp.]MDS4049715.1 vWA domain-containing protein [Accumulibacter sp.]